MVESFCPPIAKWPIRIACKNNQTGRMVARGVFRFDGPSGSYVQLAGQAQGRPLEAPGELDWKAGKGGGWPICALSQLPEQSI